MDFDEGFNLMMSASLEYETLKRQRREIPQELQERMKKWCLNGLTI